jgi:hypothetical protein
VEWLPSSPDAAPIDYAIWDYLKQRLNKTETKSLDEMEKHFYMNGQKWIKLREHVKIYSGRKAAIPSFLYFVVPLFLYSSIP